MRLRNGIVLALVLATVAFVRWRPEPTFPHARHAKLFPTCVGCHDGVINEQATDRFPSPEACAQCHDGDRLQRVTWTGHRERPTNLRFSHVEHVREAQKEGTTVECQNCHKESPSATSAMAVAGAQPTNCIGCHAHQATEHLADNAVCATCHLPVARAVALSDSEIASFPKPASHGRSDFLSTHGPKTVADAARCATCHARESCARCHPNASRVDAITSLGADARIARLVAARPAEYPTPTNHKQGDWALDHGATARRDVQSCANCHTQQSCRTCHTGRLASTPIAELPDGSQGGGPGVQGRHYAGNVTPRNHRQVAWASQQHGPVAKANVQQCASCHAQQSCKSCHTGSLASQAIAALSDGRDDTGPGVRLQAVALRDTAHRVRVHPADFVSSHGTTAGSGRLTCQGCHEQRFCSDCHDGAGRNRFHKVNYVSRHATDAYSRDRNCSTCHTTETFCRTCHVNSGIASKGGIQGNAHNGQPMWLLQHGQAARQGLEGCTSCHQQRDCLRCHSATGLHMNPHGPGFDASRMSARNKQVCRTCHLTDPMAK